MAQQLHLTSPGVTNQVDELDDQWNKSFHDVCSKLPERDKAWLLQNQKPFTSTQLFEYIRPRIRKYTQHGFQKFISAIDPIVSHINSFTGIINTFVQTHPEISGLIWGSLYLLITVGIVSTAKAQQKLMSDQLAGRAQKTLELIVDFLERISPDLSVFKRWCRLFPERSFKEVSQTIQHVYEEVIYFCVEAVRFLRRNPVGEQASLTGLCEMRLQMHQRISSK